MDRVEKIKENYDIAEDIELTEEDIQAILESEEDIREGRIYTEKEFWNNFEKRWGIKIRR